MIGKFTEDSRSVQDVAKSSKSLMERVGEIEEHMADLTFLAHENITAIIIIAFALFLAVAIFYVRR